MKLEARKTSHNIESPIVGSFLEWTFTYTTVIKSLHYYWTVFKSKGIGGCMLQALQMSILLPNLCPTLNHPNQPFEVSEDALNSR